MEVVSNHFEQWKAEQVAREQGRVASVLRVARTLMEGVLVTSGTPREALFGNEEIIGYSYFTATDSIFPFLKAPIQALFQDLWLASTAPEMKPESVVCHVVRSDRTFEVGDSFDEPVSTRESSVYAVTFVFNPHDYGLIRATVDDSVARIKLHPGSVWRPQPLCDTKIAGYSRDLDQSPETRARLALLLTIEATKPLVLEKGQQIPQNLF